MRILVVKDDILQAEMVSGMLNARGHSVMPVDDGQKAPAAVERFAPDMILLDVFLPDTTASQVKFIQSDARIITLTGHNSRELERRLREFGITYYMVKPFQAEELQPYYRTSPAGSDPGRASGQNRVRFCPANRKNERDRL